MRSLGVCQRQLKKHAFLATRSGHCGASIGVVERNLESFFTSNSVFETEFETVGRAIKAPQDKRWLKISTAIVPFKRNYVGTTLKMAVSGLHSKLLCRDRRMAIVFHICMMKKSRPSRTLPSIQRQAKPCDQRAPCCCAWRDPCSNVRVEY